MILVIHIWISVWIINQKKYSAAMYYTSSIILMITSPQEWSTLAWAIQASSLWRDRDVQEKNFLSEIIILLPTPPRTTLIFFTASSVSDIFVIFQLEPVKYVNNNVSFCSLNAFLVLDILLAKSIQTPQQVFIWDTSQQFWLLDHKTSMWTWLPPSVLLFNLSNILIRFKLLVIHLEEIIISPQNESGTLLKTKI